MGIRWPRSAAENPAGMPMYLCILRSRGASEWLMGMTGLFLLMLLMMVGMRGLLS
jgi:hypothetical protein